MNDKEMAEYAMKFLSRVQLQGVEVPAFNSVVQWLSSKIEQVPEENG